MKKYRITPLIISLAIPLLVGMLSAALSSGGMAAYGTMSKPPLSPPAWVFPVAWTILYLMMGLASYYVYVADVDRHDKIVTLRLYGVQLAMNFMWSIVFFAWKLYLFAFIWLIGLWCLVIVGAYRFFMIDRKAGGLLLPYILWLTFAAYLNLGAYVMKMIYS